MKVRTDGHINPITPAEAEEKNLQFIPSVVIKTFNKLIVKNFDLTTGTAQVTQEEVVEAIVATGGVSRSEVFDLGYLNVENLFRKAGWKVTFYKPAYNEVDEKATFTFSRKKR